MTFRMINEINKRERERGTGHTDDTHEMLQLLEEADDMLDYVGKEDEGGIDFTELAELRRRINEVLLANGVRAKWPANKT